MPTSKDFSVEDEAYLATIAAEPKMTMDEVGADIEEHGHVPVTPETATQDPFTAKGSLSYALDEALSADTDLEKTIMTRDKNDHLDSHLTNPTDDFRDETKGEVEGTTSTPQGLIQPVESNKVGEGLEPTIQQDKAVQVKDSLAEALDAITMDGAEEIEAKPPIGKDPEPDLSKYNEEEASHIPLKAPKIPPSLGGAEDTPDANGLVYVSATFTVDPDKYVSNNYRPTNLGKAPNALDALKQKRAAMNSKPAANPEEEAALSDLGTPEAKESAASPDEPTPQQEESAAKDADKEQKEEIEVEVKEETASVIPTPKKDDKPAQDEAPEKVVLDYATFIDGSSFICYDEVADIDYSKIAMDAGPKKAPTRATCQTTFAQCRAENPLFCRFHGPKLLEADIKTAIKATVGPGCVVQVTKDKNSKNKFTFRLTVGCPPSKKKMVEKMVHMYLTQNPGITSSTEDWNLVGKHKQTQEFEMDILQADKPPKKDTKADQMLSNTKKAIKEHKKQDVVGETAPGLEKKAAKGEKWQTVDEDIENEWADLVDKTVHKSLLGNNEEFLANFNQIANQFDAAHDAGDANGLKQALEALKEEIGKYDENGEKKPEAATVEAEVQETTEEPAAPEAPQQQAEEPKVEKPVSKPTASSVEQPSNDDEAEFDKLVNEAEENGLFNNDDFQKKYQQIFFDGKTDMAAKVAAMKGLMAGAGKGSGSGNGGESAAPVQKPIGGSGDADIVRAIQSAGKSVDIPLSEDDYKIIPTENGFKFKGGSVFKGSTDLQEAVYGALTKLGYKAKGSGQVMDFTKGSKESSANEEAVTKEDILDFFGNKTMVKADLQKWLELANNGTYEGGSPTEYFEAPSPVYKNVGEGLQKVMEMKGADHPMTKALVKAGLPLPEGMEGAESGGSEEVVLPAPPILSKGSEGEQSTQSASNGGNAASSPHDEKAKELGKKLFDMKHKFSNVVKGADAETINALNNALIGAEHTYDKLANQLDTIGELDAQMKAVGEDSDLFEVDKTFEQKLLEDSKKKAEGQASVLLDELESALSGIEKSFASAQETAADKKKGEIASSVEQMIKNLSVCVFGGKRPPQGVDSVVDYLDYLKDELESDAEENITPDEMAEIEGHYHLEDYYKSTKAAAKALDDAIEAFKDKMDNVPGQGEDSGAYQAEIEQMQKAIGEQASEVLMNFNAYKNALGHCKYEADAANKLAASKKKLEGGGAQGSSSGGEVTKADVEDFFDDEFDESDEGEKGSLDLWLEMANKGTWGGGSPKNYFESVGGWLQDKMKKKGINHPMTQALIKAGLNPPKGMEQQAQGTQGGEGKKPVKPFDFAAWEKEKKAGGNPRSLPFKKKAQPTAQPKPQSEEPVQQAPSKPKYTDEEKKAKISAMSPKQKVEAAVKIFKKKIAANPNDADAKAKLAKYEAMLAKLNK